MMTDKLISKALTRFDPIKYGLGPFFWRQIMKINITNIISTRVTIIALVLLIASSAAHVLAAPGDFDTTFGQGGVVFDSASSQSCMGLYPRASAVQADGKIIVVGSIFDDCNYTAYNAPVTSRRLYVRRYRSNGTPDNGPWWTSPFGVDGFGVSTIGSGISLTGDAAAILIQSDGKILVGGTKWSFFQGSSAVVWRFSTDGQLDTAFGTNGLSTFSSNLNPANASAFAFMNNKLIVGVSTGNNTDIRLFRLLSNGNLDPTFGYFAQIITGITPAYPHIGMDVDAALGVIYVSGKMQNGTNSDGVVARYYPNGNLDTTFGSAGRAFYPVCLPTSGNVPIDVDAFTNVAVQSGGQVVVAGDGQLVGLSAAAFVTRFTAGGAIDSTFGPATSSPCSSNTQGLGSNMRKQTDDKVLFRYVRYDANGTTDPTFNVNNAQMHGYGGTISIEPGTGKIVYVNINDNGNGTWIHRVLP